MQQKSSSKEMVTCNLIAGDASGENQTPLKRTLLKATETEHCEQRVHVSRNGLRFTSIEEVMMALDAALEVNDHLRQQVEEKGSLVISLGAKVAACESRYQKLLEGARNLEKRISLVESVGDATRQEDNDVEEWLQQQVTTVGAEGCWESDMVSMKRKALLKKGAQQGWLMKSCELDLGVLIGQGSFGQTFEASWRGTRVAVKAAVAPQTSAEALNVLREIDCFSSIKHPNVLPFLGACLCAERCLLVTEFMTGGNLRDWIHGRTGARKPHRKLSERLTMALHV